MRRIGFARVGLALAGACTSAAGVSNASAQTADQAWAYCNNSNNQYGAELRIGGCTSVIQNAWADLANMAIAFNNRGLAYYAQRDYTRAIADYDQALRLNPQYAFGFYNRGLSPPFAAMTLRGLVRQVFPDVSIARQRQGLTSAVDHSVQKLRFNRR